MTKKNLFETDLHTLTNRCKKEISPTAKLLIEAGPLSVFFFANYKGNWLIEHVPLFRFFDKPIFPATVLFIIATLIALGFSWHIARQLPIIPFVSGLFVIIFGCLTLWFHDDIFIKMKPTIVNLFFSAALFIGLYFKKPLLGYVFDSAFDLSDEGWVKLSWRWAFFFLFLAILNEAVWRNFSTSFWAAFKIFGTLPLTMVFLACQVPLLLKHMRHPELKNEGDTLKNDTPKE